MAGPRIPVTHQEERLIQDLERVEQELHAARERLCVYELSDQLALSSALWDHLSERLPSAVHVLQALERSGLRLVPDPDKFCPTGDTELSQEQRAGNCTAAPGCESPQLDQVPTPLGPPP